MDLLWEYQELDIQIDSCQNELKNSEERQRLLKLKNFMMETKSQMQNIEGSAEQLDNQYNELVNEYEKAITKMQDYQNSLKGEINSIEQTDKLKKDSARLADTLISLEKKLVELINESEQKTKKYSYLSSQGGRAKKEYEELIVIYEKKKEIAQEEINTLKEKLNEKSSLISKDFLTKYQNVKQNKPIPIAKLVGNQCTGCHMELPSVFTKKVIGSKLPIECENCGRILYIHS